MNKNQIIAGALRKIAAAYETDVDKLKSAFPEQLYQLRNAERANKYAANVADYGEALNGQKWYQKANDSWVNKVLNPVGWLGSKVFGKVFMDPYRKRQYNENLQRLQNHQLNRARLSQGKEPLTYWRPSMWTGIFNREED